MTTAASYSRAEAAGRLAARAGTGIKSCPYEANGTPEQRVLAARFVHAYLVAGGAVAASTDDGPDAAATAPGTAGPIVIAAATGVAMGYAAWRIQQRGQR